MKDDAIQASAPLDFDSPPSWPESFPTAIASSPFPKGKTTESKRSSSSVCGICRGLLSEPPSSLSPNSPEGVSRQAVYHESCCPDATRGVAIVVCMNARNAAAMFTEEQGGRSGQSDSPRNGSRKKRARRESEPDSENSDMSCLHPYYHLSCVSIPIGSRLYRDALTEHYARMCRGRCRASKRSCLKTKSSVSSLSITPTSMSLSPLLPPVVGNTECEDRQIRRGFLCPYCDVEGTSHYLVEYFEAYRKAKTKFCHDDEAVDRVCPASKLGRAFVLMLLAKGATANAEAFSASTTQNICSTTSGVFKSSEVRLDLMEKITKSIANVAGTADNILHTPRRQLHPSDLVGQPIRLFNPIEDAYHVGRIVDYKTIEEVEMNPSLSPNSRSSVESYRFDDAIGRTQYLVRFRAGVDGRKIPVHQWIFLEEHALNVGVALVWGDTGTAANVKCDNTSGCEDISLHHRPAQVMFRTAIEMIPVKGLNESPLSTKTSALAYFFGKDFHHAVLHFEHHEGIRDGVRSKEVSCSKFVASDFLRISNQLKTMLRQAPYDDNDLAKAIALASMESEEQRRIRQFLKLPPALPASTGQ